MKAYRQGPEGLKPFSSAATQADGRATIPSGNMPASTLGLGYGRSVATQTGEVTAVSPSSIPPKTSTRVPVSVRCSSKRWRPENRPGTATRPMARRLISAPLMSDEATPSGRSPVRAR